MFKEGSDGASKEGSSTEEVAEEEGALVVAAVAFAFLFPFAPFVTRPFLATCGDGLTENSCVSLSRATPSGSFGAGSRGEHGTSKLGREEARKIIADVEVEEEEESDADETWREAKWLIKESWSSFSSSDDISIRFCLTAPIVNRPSRYASSSDCNTPLLTKLSRNISLSFTWSVISFESGVETSTAGSESMA